MSMEGKHALEEIEKIKNHMAYYHEKVGQLEERLDDLEGAYEELSEDKSWVWEPDTIRKLPEILAGAFDWYAAPNGDSDYWEEVYSRLIEIRTEADNAGR